MNPLVRTVKIIDFFFFYLKELVASNVKVAFDVLTPTHHMSPAFLELPVEGLSDRQLLALSNLISMTPGTLSLDIRDDRSTLMIHCMYAKDPAAILENLSANYLRRVRDVF